MPKVLYFSDPSNKRPGIGATIRLDSGEPCLISVAKNWVRVRKSRLGFLGPLLYDEKDAAETANALALLFPDDLLPPGFTNPILRAFANAVLHCSTCAEAAVALNEAVAKAGKLATGDAQIISEYATFLAETTTRPDCFYDESVLPYPKKVIIAAIEREIVRAPLDEWVDWLNTSGLFLWNFQDGVGAAPLPLTGFDVSQLPRGNTPDDLDKLKQIMVDPNVKRAEERAESFKAIAQREAKEIEERLKAAVRRRS